MALLLQFDGCLTFGIGFITYSVNKFKISLCTVCMNRLHHVRQTLRANILDNSDYDNLEFVLLDYNSSDGLENWIRDEMQPFIETGRLKYFRTEEPQFFDRTHSRNLMFKLASGEILANVDADNFTGKGYASFINEEFNKDFAILLVADTEMRHYFLRNAFGRFCCSREAYFKVRGMDESMKSYGSETLDLYARLKRSGLKEVVIHDTRFLQAISHSDDERIENEFFLKNIEKFYIRFYAYDESEILFLFRNGLFERCKITPETERTHLPARLIDGSMEKGVWSIEGKFLLLSCNVNPYFIVDAALHNEVNEKPFYEINDRRFLKNVAKNYSFIVNTQKMYSRPVEKDVEVNASAFGQGNVVLNFTQQISTY